MSKNKTELKTESKTESKDPESRIESDLESISEELTKLSKATKLKDILKKHKTIKTNLDDVSNKINLIKSSFELANENSKDVIDDETYDKYSKEILDLLETDFDNLDIDTQVKKYKILSKKIMCCDNYLKSKKIEIIDCDKKQEELNDISSDSVSSDDE